MIHVNDDNLWACARPRVIIEQHEHWRNMVQVVGKGLKGKRWLSRVWYKYTWRLCRMIMCRAWARLESREVVQMQDKSLTQNYKFWEWTCQLLVQERWIALEQAYGPLTCICSKGGSYMDVGEVVMAHRLMFAARMGPLICVPMAEYVKPTGRVMSSRGLSDLTATSTTEFQPTICFVYRQDAVTADVLTPTSTWPHPHYKRETVGFLLRSTHPHCKRESVGHFTGMRHGV